MSLATIEVNSHNIVVKKMKPAVIDTMLSFCKNYIQFHLVTEKGKRHKKVRAVYAASPIDNREFRIHKNTEEKLFAHLRKIGYKDTNFNIIRNDPPEAVDIELILKDTREPRPYQITLIDYIINDGNTKIVTLGTGGGKTFVTLQAIYKLSKRTAIIIPGKYVGKWINDVEEAFDLNQGDLIVVRGSCDLKKVINSAIDDELNAKIIIITSLTIYNYIKDYEYNLHNGYMVPPGELFELLGVGIKLIDECHQFLHLNYKIDLYTNVEKAIFLSATLESSEPFVNTILSIIYPESMRMQGTAHKKYIDVYSLCYYIRRAKRIRCERNKSYSHAMFEKSLRSFPILYYQYIEMIASIVTTTFITKRREGQKMLIFASTIDMCTAISEHLAFMWPHMDIARYVADDPLENLHENDIVVSTLGSAGTAVDIINLKTCLMTVSVDSKQQNIQALGRLRELVNYEEDTPEFYYLYCGNVQKQYQYHIRKDEIFRPYCKSIQHRHTGITLSD